MAEPSTPRPPLTLPVRLAILAGTVAVAVGAVVVVVRHEADAPERARAALPSVTTYAVPPDILVPRTRPYATAPPATGGTVPRAEPTNDQVQVALETVIKRRTGWTHKVLCIPDRPLFRGEVLGCHATTEPPIKEQQPSDVLAVVVGDDGRFVWVRGTDGPFTLAALDIGEKSCGDLRNQGWPWASVLAYDEFNHHPASIDRDADGRPCVAAYGTEAVDAAFGEALTP